MRGTCVLHVGKFYQPHGANEKHSATSQALQRRLSGSGRAGDGRRRRKA